VINGAVNVTATDEDVKAELRGFRDATKHAIAQKIDEHVHAGRFPEQTDSSALAAFYAAVVQGMSTQACDGASHEDLTRVVDLARQAWSAARAHR
jgi:TetR/AcrR family transcriptional regulator, copper-responsive repressor